MTFRTTILSLQKSRVNFAGLSDLLQIVLSRPTNQIPDTIGQAETIISNKKELKGIRSSVIYYRKEVISLTKLALESFKLANIPPEKKLSMQIKNFTHIEIWYTEDGKVEISEPFEMD